MEQFEQIREQQKESWNSFSSGWRKWDDLVMDFLQPMGNEIIRLLDPKDNNLVLDVAGGTGEPGLTIATKLHGGKVIITDLAADMLAIAREKAAKRGIEDVETLESDACNLPFNDNTFDAISCRFGFMFFPDMLLAAKEMVRVLKPGGKIAVSVWNVPEKNFWVTAITEAINRNMDLPAPQPGAPGIFRCAQEGLIADIFLQAGLKNIYQEEVHGKLNCKTFEKYWSMQTEVVAPIVASLVNADDILKDKIKREVFETVTQKYPDGNISIDSSALIIYGEK